MECNLWLTQPVREWHNFEANDPHQWKMTPPWENESRPPPWEIDPSVGICSENKKLQTV